MWVQRHSIHRYLLNMSHQTTHDGFLQLVSRCENFIHGDSSLPPDILRELWVETSIHMLLYVWTPIAYSLFPSPNCHVWSLLFEIERSVNDQVSWRIFRRKHARREAAIDILRFDSALQNISHLYDVRIHLPPFQASYALDGLYAHWHVRWHPGLHSFLSGIASRDVQRLPLGIALSGIFLTDKLTWVTRWGRW